MRDWARAPRENSCGRTQWMWLKWSLKENKFLPLELFEWKCSILVKFYRVITQRRGRRKSTTARITFSLNHPLDSVSTEICKTYKWNFSVNKLMLATCDCFKSADGKAVSVKFWVSVVGELMFWNVGFRCLEFISFCFAQVRLRSCKHSTWPAQICSQLYHQNSLHMILQAKKHRF